MEKKVNTLLNAFLELDPPERRLFLDELTDLLLNRPHIVAPRPDFGTPPGRTVDRSAEGGNAGAKAEVSASQTAGSALSHFSRRPVVSARPRLKITRKVSVG